MVYLQMPAMSKWSFVEIASYLSVLGIQGGEYHQLQLLLMGFFVQAAVNLTGVTAQATVTSRERIDYPGLDSPPF